MGYVFVSGIHGTKKHEDELAVVKLAVGPRKVNTFRAVRYVELHFVTGDVEFIGYSEGF